MWIGSGALYVCGRNVERRRRRCRGRAIVRCGLAAGGELGMEYEGEVGWES